MTSQARMGSLSRAAIYAQRRRDNEAEAREELGKQLPAQAFRPEFSTRGEFNLTTKTLLATLLFLDPNATIHDVPKLDPSTVEYNQHRRANETSIRDRVEAMIPDRILTPDITSRSDFNKTTKVMIGACLRVKEALEEREDAAESSSSTDLDTQSNMSLSGSSTISQDETPVRKKARSAHVQPDQVIPQRQTVAQPEQIITAGSQQSVSYELRQRDTSETTSTRTRHFQPIMAPTTRSTSNQKTRTLPPKPLILPHEDPSSDDTVVPTEPDENADDLFVNLRKDELDQEMNLDVKPQPLPKKAFQNQGYWEIKPRDPKNAPHGSGYVRALEQAANRLVAKAKELVIAHEGDDDACQKPLVEAQEWCIDTIDMIAGEIDRKKYRKKWTDRKMEWESRRDSDLSLGE